jgi:hypothetical protein
VKSLTIGLIVSKIIERQRIKLWNRYKCDNLFVKIRTNSRLSIKPFDKTTSTKVMNDFPNYMQDLKENNSKKIEKLVGLRVQ